MIDKKSKTYLRILAVVYDEIVEVEFSDCTPEYQIQVDKALEKIMNIAGGFE